MKPFSITIKGTRWRYRLLPNDAYTKLHGDDSNAVTVTDNHTADFNEAVLAIVHVRHELLHMYCDSLHLSSATLNQDAMEEIFAALISENWERMDAQARTMYAKMKGTLNEKI